MVKLSSQVASLSFKNYKNGYFWDQENYLGAQHVLSFGVCKNLLEGLLIQRPGPYAQMVSDIFSDGVSLPTRHQSNP